MCCHLPLHPGTCPGACLLWNYEEALKICREPGNVVATISGHAHQVSASPQPNSMQRWIVQPLEPSRSALCAFAASLYEVRHS